MALPFLGMTLSVSTQRPNRRVQAASGWLKLSVATAVLVLVPFIALLFEAAHGSDGLWTHLAASVLPTAFFDTVILLTGVGLLVAFMGTGAAWLVTAYEFPGRRTMEWALLLPLAVPTYIVAYAYLDILHPIGPAQSAVRWLLGYSSPREFRLPDIRSMTGCILLLGFVLYPYVYVATRAMFLTQPASLIEVSRTLGVARSAVFRRVALPLARPAIVVGVSLALMETLNDIGASEFLGVRTLTVSIYTTWITRSDLAGASQLALGLLIVVVAVVVAEQYARRMQRFAPNAQRSGSKLARHKVSRPKGLLMLALCLLPVCIGFVAPAVHLATEAYARIGHAGLPVRFLANISNTVLFSAIATLMTLATGATLAYAVRLRTSAISIWSYRIATIGYAAPGTVVALGLLISLGAFDRTADRLATSWAGFSTGLLFLGSGAALLYAYSTRFLAISAGAISAGLSRIPQSLDDASRTLGQTATGTLRRIHLPLSKTALAASGLLVFVDCVKELPATLLLRQLNVETLATHLYGEAARGTYEEASISALTIVIVAMLPVLWLARVGHDLRR